MYPVKLRPPPAALVAGVREQAMLSHRSLIAVLDILTQQDEQLGGTKQADFGKLRQQVDECETLVQHRPIPALQMAAELYCRAMHLGVQLTEQQQHAWMELLARNTDTRHGHVTLAAAAVNAAVATSKDVMAAREDITRSCAELQAHLQQGVLAATDLETACVAQFERKLQAALSDRAQQWERLTNAQPGAFWRERGVVLAMHFIGHGLCGDLVFRLQNGTDAPFLASSHMLGLLERALVRLCGAGPVVAQGHAGELPAALAPSATLVPGHQPLAPVGGTGSQAATGPVAPAGPTAAEGNDSLGWAHLTDKVCNRELCVMFSFCWSSVGLVHRCTPMHMVASSQLAGSSAYPAAAGYPVLAFHKDQMSQSQGFRTDMAAITELFEGVDTNTWDLSRLYSQSTGHDGVCLYMRDISLAAAEQLPVGARRRGAPAIDSGAGRGSGGKVTCDTGSGSGGSGSRGGVGHGFAASGSRMATSVAGEQLPDPDHVDIGRLLALRPGIRIPWGTEKPGKGAKRRKSGG